MFYTTQDNLKLYYEIQGNPNSTKSVIFLNGLSQSTVAWQLMLPAFTEDYKIILCDFIFQGQSDAEGDWRDFDQHANDVAGLINSLNIDKITIIGISYGSLVAQHFALNYPNKVEKLILLSTFAHKTPIFEAISLSWQRALETGGYPLMLDVMLPSVLSEAYFNKPIIPIDILKAARKNINSDPDALRKLMMATAKRGDYRPQLKAIKTPTLIVHGEQDALLPLHLGKAVHDAMPSSTFEVIDGVGHTLNLEAVVQTVQAIKKHLSS